MYLSKLELKNFRNYKRLKLKLSSSINIFIGDNAQGKTNILESIYVLALTKSQRFGAENNLIRQNCEEGNISGVLKDNKKLKELGICLSKINKKVSVNGKNVPKISDYIFHMKVIMFGPEDLGIIKGSPQDRRNFLNIQISQLYAPYVHYLNEYNKILKNRNEYLKLMNLNQYTDPRYLEILDEKLVDRAVSIYRYRNEYFSFISSRIGTIFEKITGDNQLKIKLENNLDLIDYSEEEIRLKFSKKLKSNRKKELLQGATLYGPHRDDFSFFIGEDNMKIFSSQGQQRLAVICFKIVEIELFNKIVNTTPILLLDDIFSELDVRKRNQLIRYLPTDVQVIMTTTDLKNISKKLVEKGRVFVVQNGNVEEKVGKEHGE